MKKDERSSNFELLRIISMILIILSHYVTHGGLIFQEISLNQIIAQLFKLGGKLGVTCFVLISGYFLVDSRFKSRNIGKIYLQIIFYSVISIGIVLLFGEYDKRFIYICIIKNLLTPVYDVYWYPTAYIGLYLCFPILNIIIFTVKEKLKNILIIMFVILSLLNFIFLKSNFLYSNIAWFIFLYFCGAYYKKNKNIIIEKKLIMGTIINVSIMWGMSIFLSYIGYKYNIKFIIDKAYYFSRLNSPFMFATGLGVFLYFKDLKYKNNVFINYLGSTTFAIYLLHDNNFARGIIWKKIFYTPLFFKQSVIIIICHMVLCIVVLFISAILLEIPRKYLSNRILNSKFLLLLLSKIDKWYYF